MILTSLGDPEYDSLREKAKVRLDQLGLKWEQVPEYGLLSSITGERELVTYFRVYRNGWWYRIGTTVFRGLKTWDQQLLDEVCDRSLGITSKEPTTNQLR